MVFTLVCGVQELLQEMLDRVREEREREKREREEEEKRLDEVGNVSCILSLLFCCITIPLFTLAPPIYLGVWSMALILWLLSYYYYTSFHTLTRRSTEGLW